MTPQFHSTGDLGGKSRFHFIGIGGIGMSALAEILLRRGCSVSGSDLSGGAITENLTRLGARVLLGHAAENLGDAEVVVVSTAIRAENPERLAAIAHGIPVIHRAALLSELMRGRRGITVTGTHGKTTVTSMLATVLVEAGRDPTVVVGSRVLDLGGNARLGKGPLFVAEADESDRSFLRFFPEATILTNIDSDHLESYRDLRELENAFAEYLRRIPFYGAAVLCGDDERLARLAATENVHTRLLTYGLDASAQWTAQDVEAKGFRVHYRCLANGTVAGTVDLPIPGLHNVQNSLAAAAMSSHLGLSFEEIRRGLGSYRGAERRLQWKGERQGVWVLDDYAHHPTEIRATLEACWQLERDVTVVYQPHRYSRTRDLLGKMGDCFARAKNVILLDIYPAGEDPIEGVSSELLVQEIRAWRSVSHMTASEALDRLRRDLRAGDVLLTMGAGDVWKLGEEYLG